jgi:hypothetical protein
MFLVTSAQKIGAGLATFGLSGAGLGNLGLFFGALILGLYSQPKFKR